MTENKHRESLLEELRKETPKAINNLNYILSNLPNGTTELDIQISPCQDNDGTLSIDVALGGKDLYVLNKAIEGKSDLFEVKHTADGLSKDIPYVDEEEVGYDVYIIVCETAIQWCKEIGKEIQSSSIPITIIIADDFGEFAPVKIN